MPLTFVKGRLPLHFFRPDLLMLAHIDVIKKQQKGVTTFLAQKVKKRQSEAARA